MISKSAHRKRCLLKTTGIILALAFGMSFFAGAGFAKALCGGDCCCPPHGNAEHKTGTMLMAMDVHNCCTGGPAMPCGIESGRSADLPEFFITAGTSNSSNTTGIFISPIFLFIEADQLHTQVVGHTGRAPYPYPSISLYLQKRSLLI